MVEEFSDEYAARQTKYEKKIELFTKIIVDESKTYERRIEVSKWLSNLLERYISAFGFSRDFDNLIGDEDLAISIILGLSDHNREFRQCIEDLCDTVALTYCYEFSWNGFVNEVARKFGDVLECMECGKFLDDYYVTHTNEDGEDICIDCGK